jgi:prepilin-type processing-associated H-X9-DG protein
VQTTNGWAKAYGFADGHAEIHSAADGNFADWEAQHIVAPPTTTAN